MIERHLYGTGDFLTACYLSVAIPKTLTTELSEVTCGACKRALVAKGVCHACGSTSLMWSFTTVKTTEVQDGRLCLNEIRGEFYLGCEECSETLARLDAEDAAAFINAGSKRTLAQYVFGLDDRRVSNG